MKLVHIGEWKKSIRVDVEGPYRVNGGGPEV